MILKFGLDADGPSIIFTDAALEMMAKYRQLKRDDKEAGGQLFALFKGGDTYVVDATPPKPLDIRRRYGFKPNKWLQKMDIKAKYRQGLHFVGDWHTHPEPVPTPSQMDMTSANECFKQSRHQLKAFLMVILGTTSPPDGLAVYLVNNTEFKRLKFISPE